MKPTIHLNGTHPQDLATAYRDACASIDSALGEVQTSAPNAHDYYTQGPDAYAAARNEHVYRIERLAAIRTELMALAIHCQDAADERSAR